MSQIPQERLTRIRRVEFAINKNLFIVSAIITVVAIIMAVIEFFSRGAFPPSGMSVFYIGVLIIYSFHKEMLRWLGEKEVERQGEGFLYAWIGLAVALYTINFLTKGYFNYSPDGATLESLREVSLITLEVSGVFILTRLSKVIKIILEKKQPER